MQTIFSYRQQTILRILFNSRQPEEFFKSVFLYFCRRLNRVGCVRNETESLFTLVREPGTRRIISSPVLNVRTSFLTLST